MRDDVDLLGAERDTRDAADEAEDDDGEEERREPGIAPGRLGEPPEESLPLSAFPHRDLDRGRDGKAVDHRGEDGEVHGVGRVPDLPRGADAGVDEEVVGGGEVDEEDVEDEGGAADGLVDGPRADGERREKIPAGDHGADVDLLGGVSEAPPHQAIPARVERLDEVHGPEQGGDVDGGAVQERLDGDDGRRGGAEDDERHRSGIGLVALGDVDGREVVEDADEGSDGEERDPEVEDGVGLQGRVGRHQDVALPHQDDDVDGDGADGHHHERDPGGRFRGQARVQENGAAEVEDGHLHEDDPEDEHVQAMKREDAVVHDRIEKVDGLPAGEREEQGGDGADEEEDDGEDGVEAREELAVQADVESGRGAGTNASCCVIAFGFHYGLLTRRGCGRSSGDDPLRRIHCR